MTTVIKCITAAIIGTPLLAFFVVTYYPGYLVQILIKKEIRSLTHFYSAIHSALVRITAWAIISKKNTGKVTHNGLQVEKPHQEIAWVDIICIKEVHHIPFILYEVVTRDNTPSLIYLTDEDVETLANHGIIFKPLKDRLL